MMDGKARLLPGVGSICVERVLWADEVAGSNPVLPIKSADYKRQYYEKGTINMADEMKSREVGELSVKVSADVGEALTGFKALQRELRETTKAARELERAYEDVEKAINSRGVNVEIDGEKVGKAIYPTTFDLQTNALKRAVEESEQIPDRLREDILAKFAEDEAKIAELNRKLNDLSEVPTKELHEELARREGVKEYMVNLDGTAKICVNNDDEGLTEAFGGPAKIIVNRD